MSDSESDDDMKFKNKRLRPSRPGTAPGSDTLSESDHKDSVQEQLKAIVSSRKNPSTSSAHPFGASSAANVPPAVSSRFMMGDVKPRLDAAASGMNAINQDIKPNVPGSSTLGAAAGLTAAGPAAVEDKRITEAGM